MTKILENDKKSESNVVQEIEKVMADVYKHLFPEPLDQQIFGQLLKLLSRGFPVKPDEIATNIQTTPENVISTVRRFGATLDNEGNIIGFGLTLVPTPHVYKIDGHTLYTWCAADALSFPVILEHIVTVESHDPVTGEKIHVKVGPDMLEDVEPKTAVVSFVKDIKHIDATNVRGTGCNKINFFASPDSASKWIEKHPDMMLYSVNELYQGLRQVHLKKYSDIQAENKQEKMCC